MIEIENLSFTYGSDIENTGRTDKAGITDINLIIKPGECVLLCGASGCGKTTLTKTINGLIPYFYDGNLDGRVLLDEREVKHTPMYILAKSVASVFQNPKTQFFNSDAESEITFSLENQGVAPSEINRRLSTAVEVFNISHLISKSMFEMSGGEKQIIAFVGAYISDAKVIVLDEPSANLDMCATKKIRSIIEKMKRGGRTIIVSEHRISYLNGIADTVYYMKSGRIIKKYSADEFFVIPKSIKDKLGLRQLEEPEVTTIKYEQSAELSNECILEGKNLTLAYGKHIVADHISFSFKAGDIIGIVGKNGVGKSTLTRVLCGLSKQKDGEILWNDYPLNSRKRRNLCGIVMQDVNYQLFSDSLIEECKLGNQGLEDATIHQVLKELHLCDYGNAHPQSLSGGQKQRLAIAVALLSDKKILILDEPTSGLDYDNMLTVSRLLKSLAEKGMICIVITHDSEFLRSACNRCFLLKESEMVQVCEISHATFSGSQKI